MGPPTWYKFSPPSPCSDLPSASALRFQNPIQVQRESICMQHRFFKKTSSGEWCELTHQSARQAVGLPWNCRWRTPAQDVAVTQGIHPPTPTPGQACFYGISSREAWLDSYRNILRDGFHYWMELLEVMLHICWDYCYLVHKSMSYY